MNKNTFQVGDRVLILKAPAGTNKIHTAKLVGTEAEVWLVNEIGVHAGPDAVFGPKSWWYGPEELELIRRPESGDGWFRVSEWVENSDSGDRPLRRLVPQCLVWATNEAAALTFARVPDTRGRAERVYIPATPDPGTKIEL